MFLVLLINSCLVIISVLVHYECLFRLTQLIPKMKIAHRYRIVVGVIGGLIAHTIEIWIFAIAYYVMNRMDGWGRLEGSSSENFSGSLMDCGYFSFTVFTTLGFGDIEPIGYLRYLTGIESLAGLVLITWTASFLFFEMQRHWREK